MIIYNLLFYHLLFIMTTTQQTFIDEHTNLFSDLAIGSAQPDQIIFDTEKGDHKVIRFTKPENFQHVTTKDQFRTKGGYYFKDNTPCYAVVINMYHHNTRKNKADEAINIRIGSKDEIALQKNIALTKPGKRVLADNPNKTTT